MEPQDIQRYLQEVLDPGVHVRRWDAKRGLPFYLQDGYDFAAVTLLDTPCVLMIAARPLDGDVEIRRHLDMVEKHAPDGALAVYVTSALASYERRRLIAQRIPFIVPGNQLFLSPLGIDLREYFRDRADPKSSLSPSTQALLFTALLRSWADEIHPELLNERLGYTPMTLSRATRELQAAGLAVPFTMGRERWLRFDQGPAEIWQRAQAWLRSPVQRVHWVRVESDDAPLAGMSALAARSALAEPAYQERAVSVADWRQAQRNGVHALPARETGATQWQVWRYEPRHLAEHGLVDPLSLIVSLRDEPDERVQQALEQLEARLPWR